MVAIHTNLVLNVEKEEGVPLRDVFACFVNNFVSSVLVVAVVSSVALGIDFTRFHKF